MRMLQILPLLWPMVLVAALDEWQKWGPYRPNLYVGVRPQIPKTLLTGLMWASGEDQASMLRTIRDTCEQDDGMDGYGWTIYDTRVGGSQTIHDPKLGVDMTVDFVKSSDGQAWGLMLGGVPKTDDVKTAITFHIALEDAHGDAKRKKALECHMAEPPSDGKLGALVECGGNDPALGAFEFKIFGDAKNLNKAVHGMAVKSVNVSEDMIWQAKSVFMDQNKDVTKDTMVLDGPGEGNIHFLQTVFQGPFTMEFIFWTPSATDSFTSVAKDISTRIKDLYSSFPSRVDAVFARTGPFEHDKYAPFTQSLISNLLGGLGFFYGDSKVDKSHAPEYEETDIDFWNKAADFMGRGNVTMADPTPLISHTPSRPFFPRGFLWDEGFHLLPVIEWDLDLAVSVLQSWLNLMDEDGWIGREQILGPEARSKVPEQFQVQYPHYANPPTLTLLVPILISKITGNSPYRGNPSRYVSSPDEAKRLLKELYPLLARHHNWFRRTQAGNFSGVYPRPRDAVPGEGYRWRGRTPTHTLTSGLDDYPRANPPHPGELHVDALAWVGASAGALHQVAQHLGETDDAMLYTKQYIDIRHNLEVLHWDKTRELYCDATINRQGQYERVCHVGYVSLMPLFLGLLDARHPRLTTVLRLLADEKKIWSPYGLRSLSRADEKYGKDEDYWRGAVWINLNVLAVLRLRELGTPQAQTLAADLRRRLVRTVYDDWTQTGFFWEQYDDETGRGRRTRAFTGWTACILLLMNLEFDDDGEERRGFSFTSMIVVVGIMGLFVWMARKRWLPWWKLTRQRILGHNRRRRVRRRLYEEVVDLDEQHEMNVRVY